MHIYMVSFIMALATVSHAETVSPGDMTKAVHPGQTAQQMSDIHDIASLMPAHGIPGWAVIAASLTAAVLVAIASFLIWKKFRKTPLIKTTPQLPPWEEALKKLEVLSKSMGKYSKKEFYFSLSEILRRYVSRRYSIDAMEMTAEELRPILDQFFASLTDLKELRIDIKSFIARSDMVKFAPESTDNEKMDDDIILIRKIVEMTMPVQNDNNDDSDGQALNQK